MRFWDCVAEIVFAVEPLYKVLRHVDMEKTPQMGHLYHYIHQAQEEIKRVIISLTKYKSFIDIISQRWEDQMGHDILIVAYYLNPAYQYRYDLGTMDSLLYLFRKVIQRMSASTREAAQALNESRFFRDSSGNFGDPFAISCRDSMDPAPTLRKISTRILSQTTSSSGCERNWSTFALIHTKPHNWLSYARLENLVYIHYNMRLRMRTLQNEDIQHVDPFDVEFVQDDANPIIDWWSAMESDQPLLDEPGEPPRPSPIISDALESESQPEDMTITPLDSQRIRQARRQSESDSPSSQSKGKKKATPSKAKGKAKGKRPIDPLDAIAKAEDDEEDEPSVHSNSSTKDGGDDDADGAGGEDTVVPSTLPPDDLWTNEQYFDQATQDDDYGARTGQTTQVYKKRGPRRGGGPTALQDYHHDMMSSLQEVSESTYSVSSTYSTDDTGSSSWNPNKESLMIMWYSGYQGIMPWEKFKI
ncbi:hypothetical protein Cni_G29192 [Canna indica]|uniref:HAT C-terminal dimerisation domain-containing protein n=1 Tax=Canna indica TaxID=4628 RepID=A0AAQ3LB63_9LILI|nr:hypothetical protein Cni_G29192 [Canna indica]